MTKIGIGYDVHKLASNRPLILGGITIPHTKGLLGHSDADVLTHAITDALLGALALGSIGDWFPDTDKKYKNADSIELLSIVYNKIEDKGYIIGNIDSVIIAQNPKISPHTNKIQERLSNVLKCKKNQIGVKATTTEELGFEGKEEGIAAKAVVLLNKNE